VTNQIVWRKWSDPLAPLVNGKMPLPYDPDEDDYRRSRATFEEEEEEETPLVRSSNGWIGPCITTAAGIVPLRESNLPSSLFNFWMGDTNFDLTESVVNSIAAVNGVETLDVFTRYRFRLGIGRCFNEKSVKVAIEETVRC
jgi:hypothetical protein